MSATMRASYERSFETEVAGVRMRAPMMSDSHGGRRRRLDPVLSRRAACRSAPKAPGANPGPASLSGVAGRWHGDRLQRGAWQDPAQTASPHVFGPECGDEPSGQWTPPVQGFEAMAAQIAIGNR